MKCEMKMEFGMEKEKKEKIKVCTVGHLWRWSRSPLRRPRGKDIPIIKLTGVWLKKIGFEVGKKYIVKASPSQVTLLLNDWCCEASISTKIEEAYVIEASHSQLLRFLKDWGIKFQKARQKRAGER